MNMSNYDNTFSGFIFPYVLVFIWHLRIGLGPRELGVLIDTRSVNDENEAL